MEEVSSTPNGGLEHCHPDITSQSNTSDVVYPNRPFSMWRPSTYLNAVIQNSTSRKRSIAFSEPSIGGASNYEKESSAGHAWEFGKRKKWNTLVTVMVVQARGLPQTSGKSSVFCKIRLGTEKHKTKSVSRSPQPEWKEQFELHIYREHILKVSLWNKDKQKNFMGSCMVDLSKLEKEKTHELRLDFDEGFGKIHLCVTLCTVVNDVPPSPVDEMPDEGISMKKLDDMKIVGQLHVTAVAARGLSSKPNAYCTLELHNQRVQTHRIPSSNKPVWNKRYTFDVHDITSTLDVKIKDSSIRSSFSNVNLGKVSIPLFRIVNGELRWFALKDKNQRYSAKGNHPRVLLQMSISWNPIKATLKLFSPKEVKYLQKPKKFDLDLVYKNVVFIRDLFDFLHIANDSYMRLFEWENQELSLLMLIGWLLFWFYFKPWALPLLLLAPFIFHLIIGRSLGEKMLETSYRNYDDANLLNTSERYDQNLKGKIKALPEVSMKIIANIEILVSAAERFYNLATFKVPFLSYVAMGLLCGASIAIYLIPFNYMMMGLGIYKFSRKYLDPNRTLNNDFVDFVSRIPDNEIWKNWKELSVPEPSQPSGEHSGLARGDCPPAPGAGAGAGALVPDPSPP